LILDQREGRERSEGEGRGVQRGYLRGIARVRG